MGIKDKLKNIVFSESLENEEDYEDEFEVETEVSSTYEAPTNKGVKNITSDAKLVIFDVRLFEETENIAAHLKAKKAAVVNLNKLDREFKQRTIDFLTGVIFALDGTIQKIGHNVILCTPKSISVEGEINLESDDE